MVYGAPVPPDAGFLLRAPTMIVGPAVRLVAVPVTAAPKLVEAVTILSRLVEVLERLAGVRPALDQLADAADASTGSWRWPRPSTGSPTRSWRRGAARASRGPPRGAGGRRPGPGPPSSASPRHPCDRRDREGAPGGRRLAGARPAIAEIARRVLDRGDRRAARLDRRDRRGAPPRSTGSPGRGTRSTRSHPPDLRSTRSPPPGNDRRIAEAGRSTGSPARGARSTRSPRTPLDHALAEASPRARPGCRRPPNSCRTHRKRGRSGAPARPPRRRQRAPRRHAPRARRPRSGDRLARPSGRDDHRPC